MKITILKYNKFPEGKVKGAADISIDVDGNQLVINGVKVIQGENNKHFYSTPQREYINDMGEKKYAGICGFFTKDGYQAFHAAMTSAFSAYFSQSVFTPPPPKPPPMPSYHNHGNFPCEDNSFDDVPF